MFAEILAAMAIAEATAQTDAAAPQPAAQAAPPMGRQTPAGTGAGGQPRPR